MRSGKCAHPLCSAGLHEFESGFGNREQIDIVDPLGVTDPRQKGLDALPNLIQQIVSTMLTPVLTHSKTTPKYWEPNVPRRHRRALRVRVPRSPGARHGSRCGCSSSSAVSVHPAFCCSCHRAVDECQRSDADCSTAFPIGQLVLGTKSVWGIGECFPKYGPSSEICRRFVGCAIVAKPV